MGRRASLVVGVLATLVALAAGPALRAEPSPPSAASPASPASPAAKAERVEKAKKAAKAKRAAKAAKAATTKKAAKAPPPQASQEAKAKNPLSTDERIARVGLRYLKARPWLKDATCTGLVHQILDEAGVRGSAGGTRFLFEKAQAESRLQTGALRPGHLVFFDRTFDADKDGLVDDDLTHVALVVAVEDDGTVVMVHRERSGIRQLRMNLERPGVHVEKGRVLNSYLRSPKYGPKDGPRLAGQLYRAHAAPPADVPPQKSRSKVAARAPAGKKPKAG